MDSGPAGRATGGGGANFCFLCARQVTTLQPVRVSLSALMGGHAMPVKTVAARHLLTTSFKDTLRRTVESAARDDERGQAITLTGVSRANTIQVGYARGHSTQCAGEGRGSGSWWLRGRLRSWTEEGKEQGVVAR